MLLGCLFRQFMHKRKLSSWISAGPRLNTINRAETQQFLQTDMCDQRRLRSACASVQSDLSSLSAWRSFRSWAINTVQITRRSDCADAQADQHLWWAPLPYYRNCYAPFSSSVDGVTCTDCETLANWHTCSKLIFTNDFDTNLLNLLLEIFWIIIDIFTAPDKIGITESRIIENSFRKIEQK